LHQEPPEIRTTHSMHNQRLHTTETREELYQPVKTRPSETFHARMLMVWSMSAGTLIFFILVLGSALGLEYPAPRPPLLVLAVFYVTAAPIAYYLRRSSSIWTLRKDRLWSTIIILLDLAIGTAILFLTGGAESAFLLLVPAIPFALRLLIGVTYTLAASAVLAAGVATMILLETLNLAPHFHSVLDNPPESFTKVQWVMVGNVLATLIAAVILADSIARILDEKRREATAFSEKMNLRADKLALLLRVGTAISKSSDFGKVVHNALEDIHHHFEAESTVLYLSDPETHRVKGLEALGDAAGREIQETTLATATLEAMQPRLSSVTIPGEEGEKEQRSVMVAPLIVENTGYGAIKMIAPKGPAFNKSKLALLNTVSGELASTLRTADTYQETNSNLSHATQELTALTSFTRKVSSSQEVEEIAERLLVTAQKLTSADHGFVALFPNIQAEDRNDAEEVFTIAHYPQEIADRLKTRARGEFKGICGRALAVGRPAVTDNLKDDCDPQTTMPDSQSKVGAPIIVDNRTAGILVLESKRAKAYSNQDVDFIMGLAESAAIAISNARLYKHTRQLAIRDGLTGLYDHSYFHQALEAEIERSRRYEHENSLIMIDLDDFKLYNDRFGHLAGDSVLGWLGVVLKNNMRKADLVARYGGEEFAILMPETSPDDAVSVARKLRTLVIDSQPESWPDVVTMSIGVSFYPADADAALPLIEAADRRMYEAKRQGKNKVNFGATG